MGGTPISHLYPTALFGVILRQLHTRGDTASTSHPRAVTYGKYAPVRGCFVSLSDAQISPFYSFQSQGGGKSNFLPLSNDAIWRTAFQPVSQFLMYAKHTTSPGNRGFRASHSNIAVLPFSIVGWGKPHKPYTRCLFIRRVAPSPSRTGCGTAQNATEHFFLAGSPSSAHATTSV